MNRYSVAYFSRDRHSYDMTNALCSSILRLDLGICPPQLGSEISNFESFAHYIRRSPFSSLNSAYYLIICANSDGLFLTVTFSKFLEFNRTKIRIVI